MKTPEAIIDKFTKGSEEAHLAGLISYESSDEEFVDLLIGMMARHCAELCNQSDGMDMHPKDYRNLILREFGLDT